MKKITLNEQQFQDYLKWVLKEEIATQFQVYVDSFVSSIINGETDLDAILNIGESYGADILKYGLALSDIFSEIKDYFFETWMAEHDPDYEPSASEYKIHERMLWDTLNNNWAEIIKPFEQQAKDGRDIYNTEKSLQHIGK